MPSSSEPPPHPPQALKLRQELKEWERAFADAHDGRKPTREEVKKDAKIAAKYKEYSKLRAPSTQSNKHSQSEPPLPPPLPTHDPFAPSQSRPSSTKSSKSQPPQTNNDIFKTPTKPYHTAIYDSPLSTRGRRLFGNRTRDTVGPTPQKMGKVLGIFETFTDTDSTPTRPRAPHDSPKSGNEGRVSASPANTPAFTTPRKRKAPELSRDLDSPTKRSQKDVLETPAFLRRNNHPAPFAESPPVPLPMRPLARGLSSIVAELRRLEDDAHNDDEDAMREMEEEEEEEEKKKKKIMSGPFTKSAATARVKVKPSPSSVDNDPNTGLPPPPSGAWADDVREEEPPSGTEEAAPKWKKKGLKRQHRRVIMRPVGKVSHPNDPNNTPPPPNPEEAELPTAGYDDEDLSDLDAPEPEPEPEPESKDPRAKRAKTTASKSVIDKSKAVVRKAARKISEKAHANYRRLNIRGSKGAKPAGAGRFSRKRR